MIVTCEQCFTRFKIPDDKVSDKGVKVRCTKCGHIFRVVKETAAPAATAGPSEVPPVAGGPESDPFARFGTPPDSSHGDPTRPGVFALGVEMTRMPERKRSPPLAPAFDFSTLAPPRPAAAPAAPAPFDFSALESAGLPPPPAAPDGTAGRPGGFSFGNAPAPGAPPAFDFSTLTAPPPPAAPSPQRHAPAPAAAFTPSFDFSSLGPLPPPPAFEPASQFDPLGNGPPPPPQRSPSRPPSPSPRPPPSAPSGLPQGGTDDFFGAPMQPQAEARPQALLDIPDEANDEDVKSALFDMPAPLLPPPPAGQVPLQAPAPAISFPALPPGASSTALPAASELSTRRRTAFGVVINLLIAAVLVAALVVVGSALLNDGKLTRESLSLESLKATFVPSTAFVATDISNGLYATRGGRAVFFVRGEVLNGSPSATRVLVQADIVEGAHVVRSAKGQAGAVPTAEELFNLVAADDLEKLEGRLSQRAVVVEPGASAPFLLTFTEYPPELRAFRVRVVASPDVTGPTAARP